MSDETTRTGKASAKEGSEQSVPVRNKTVHTALISGVNFHAKAVQYVALDGLAMFEGDIVLGTLEEVAAATDAARAPGDQRHLAFDSSCHLLGLLSIRHALAAMWLAAM